MPTDRRSPDSRTWPRRPGFAHLGFRWLLVGIVALWLQSGGTNSTSAQTPAVITFAHLADVHEINALEGGRVGGISRFATVLGELRRTQAPVIATLGGDYLSPSAIGTARINGELLEGRHAVAVLNTLGLDWVTFGNHEFDVSESGFRARLAESRFRIVSSNVTDAKGNPFPGTVRSALVPVRAGGRELQLGLIGLTIDANPQPWVRYLPPVQAARQQIKTFAGRADAVIAITHQSIAQDQELVAQAPELDLVLGGHEHENWLARRGRNFTPIVKADANARSMAVVTMTFGPPKSRPTTATRLQFLDDRVVQDPTVEAEVRRWTSVAFDGFRKDGFDVERTIATTTEALDGREGTVRNRADRLTDLIVAGFVREVGGADVGLLNGGSVRLDDVLQPGPITEYDTIRILPFGGKVLRASLDGALLASVLDVGVRNRGSGGYLQTWGVRNDGAQWLIQGRPLDPAARYVVALPDFLLTGRETNMPFLTRTNPATHDVREFRDVRRALIEELRATYPPVAR
jgi:5'-nucleotidase/UDP-sugar diphosphatase